MQAAPGALRAGFELPRALPEDERVLAGYLQCKQPMRVLAFAGSERNGMGERPMALEVASDVRGR